MVELPKNDGAHTCEFHTTAPPDPALVRPRRAALERRRRPRLAHPPLSTPPATAGIIARQSPVVRRWRSPLKSSFWCADHAAAAAPATASGDGDAKLRRPAFLGDLLASIHDSGVAVRAPI
jgi:hypothetical protein